MNPLDIYIGSGIALFMYLIQLGAYWYVTRFPPKEINSLYGYRTPRSMKNQANWTYANSLSNRLMLWTGHLFILIAILTLVLFHKVLSGKWYVIITTGLYIFSIVVFFAITEYKLKQFEKTQH